MAYFGSIPIRCQPTVAVESAALVLPNTEKDRAVSLSHGAPSPSKNDFWFIWPIELLS